MQNLKKNDGLSDNTTHCVYTQCVHEGENTERINDLTNNEDSNSSFDVVQNDSKETTNDLQGTATHKIGICKHCGKPFEKRTTWHVFCEEQCRADYHGVDLNQLRKRRGTKK